MVAVTCFACCFIIFSKVGERSTSVDKEPDLSQRMLALGLATRWIGVSHSSGLILNAARGASLYAIPA